MSEKTSSSESTPCPICHRPVNPSTKNEPNSPYPFCTQRCKLVDLGRWLDGKYQIPVVEEDESDAAEE
jgi:endogenous inhibitor of DNA gyrase (YacG/DUF329 family)